MYDNIPDKSIKQIIMEMIDMIKSQKGLMIIISIVVVFVEIGFGWKFFGKDFYNKIVSNRNKKSISKDIIDKTVKYDKKSVFYSDEQKRFQLAYFTTWKVKSNVDNIEFSKNNQVVELVILSAGRGQKEAEITFKTELAKRPKSVVSMETKDKLVYHFVDSGQKKEEYLVKNNELVVLVSVTLSSGTGIDTPEEAAKRIAFSIGETRW